MKMCMFGEGEQALNRKKKRNSKVFYMFSITILFMAGFHNMDTSQNMRYLGNAFDTQLVDRTLFFYATPETGYISGVIMMFLSLAIMYIYIYRS